ncbi:fungal-specific transcription factor domain-containing protein [Dactylonectria estremocensis]|uniref:Fungal-specific transcription factor domain-containing protein n=1 Tax=Dactylonectria estremocensis TaxID=1079267 RepID=A0A9P9E2Z1_9HYPO|nr:fungal-specific transcription factor domain-containing protein [Dactylonectria estremocensis]
MQNLPLGPTPEEDPTGASPQSKSTSSCAECRRRRIRCEGLTTPCRQCVYYQVPHLCHYPPRKSRRSVSWRTHTELSDAYKKSQTVLRTLFPSVPVDELIKLSREELVAKAQSSPPGPSSSAIVEVSDDNFQLLEPSTERDFAWDEVSDTDEQVSRIADDVNGLAFSTDSLRESYLGLSSVPAIMRVITHLSPQTQQLMIPSGSEAWSDLDATPGSSTSTDTDDISLINAYFYHAHPITPMVDEADFRQRYAQGGVTDDRGPSWLALLNMVLAMGCLASDTTHFNASNIHYKRAAQHLSMSSFGSGHLYTVQALGLYGGYLLHYLHKPNTASAVLGAAIRMAVAMGLHRVRLKHDGLRGSHQPIRSCVVTRMHTWWSIFCLDTWAATTLGRPNLGYWNPATVSTLTTSCLTNTDYNTISLAASEQFCKIATRIQARLVHPPLMSESEALAFDQELMKWQNSLHLFLASRDQCPPCLRVARGFLWSRLLTTRLTLYRPALLNEALQRKSISENSKEMPTLVCKCLEVARDTVDTIGQDWFPSQLMSWNSAWHLFQAALVLILAAAFDGEWARERGCDEYIGKVLELFTQVEHSSPGDTRSRELIEMLYRTVNEADITSFGQVAEQTHMSILDFLDMDIVGDDSDWVEFFGGWNE